MWDETIVAVATPPGEGGIGVIRISGPQAQAIGERILRHPSGKAITTWPERRVRLGVVLSSEQKVIDEVIFFFFRAPRSYTGEDVLEIQGHGGQKNMELILGAAMAAGARLAEPGEFTKRAFLNGRIDLAQAEAVIDLITAQTDLAHQAAQEQLQGRLSTYLRQCEERLLAVLAQIEAALDYPEDEIPEVNREEAMRTIMDVTKELTALAAQAEKGRILREAATVVLAGRPNVGKSSLLNRLLDEERAIVTPIPGTTRDFVAEVSNFQGLPVRLVDTAGLRETSDPLEQEGVRRAWHWVEKAELILIILDAAAGLSVEEEQLVREVKGKKRMFIVLNKSDLPPRLTAAGLAEKFPDLISMPDMPVLTVSAVSGEGLEDLREKIREELVGKEFGLGHPVLVTSLRHKEALERASHYLQSVTAGLRDGLSEDLLTVDLRAALEALGEITGRTVSDEVIDLIFSRFCVGK
ncbi:MAG: tRNA uridine-5-carboxymethylaminomethyl(34) synthesis GTPase MnmE [Clostridia bacterium]|nr:tRNA uridine-5-carboxymethylaminomethyl(34) synthesis GTPase MnmE [Clostridia bacterium]